jgi:peptide/nickel transport system substrate-binding protein
MEVRQTNLLADYGYSIFAMLTTHETLVRFDSAMAPVPQLAQAWESSPDAEEWKFYLREDALWHDGRPVTAEDIKFTFEYMAAHHSASAWIRDLISGIRVDGSTVTFELTKPYSRFLINVGFIIRILPRHVWEQVADPLKPGEADITLGCGPFVFDGFDNRENRIKFHRNKAYYGPRPSIEGLDFFTHLTLDALTLSLIRGDLDVYYKYASGFPPPYLPKLAENKTVQLARADAMGIPAALGFNLKQGPAANPAFRKALAPALDYEKITQSLLGESGKIPTAGFAPPAMTSHLLLPALVFSPEQSRSGFSAAGFADTDKDGLLNHPQGPNLSLTLLARSDLEGTDAILPILSHNLKEVGIDLVIERADLSTWITRVRENRHDLVLFRTTPWGMIMDAGCASGYFDSRRNGGGTLANIEDTAFHGLCDRILENTDPSVEQDLYHEVQRYYAEHLPALALCWAVGVYPSSSRLQGLVVNPVEGGLVNRETFVRVRFSPESSPLP